MAPERRTGRCLRALAALALGATGCTIPDFGIDPCAESCASLWLFLLAPLPPPPHLEACTRVLITVCDTRTCHTSQPFSLASGVGGDSDELRYGVGRSGCESEYCAGATISDKVLRVSENETYRLTVTSADTGDVLYDGTAKGTSKRRRSQVDCERPSKCSDLQVTFPPMSVPPDIPGEAGVGSRSADACAPAAARDASGPADARVPDSG
jgi:hypothetical protein